VKTRVLGNHTSTHRVLEQTRKQKHQAPTATQRPWTHWLWRQWVQGVGVSRRRRSRYH